jgi:hypothetical protein
MSRIFGAGGGGGMSRIFGAGGGGGGGKGRGGGSSNSQPQRTPTEAADNLNSAQYAQVLDLLSEGEIQGLKNGLQSIFLNDTPLQNANGTLNFQNVTVYTRNGTQDQAYIPGSADIEDEKPVGVQVSQATPVTQTISAPNVDAARITITVPQLQSFTNEGDINGTDVRLQIAVQYGGGGYTTVIDDTIAGRTADTYQRDYLVGLVTTPADIRLTRITPDSSSAKLANAFNWTSYTEITYAKLRYPNSALIGLRVDAEQFSSIPSRSYLIRGIKVRIPSNATVDNTNGRLVYSGIWNGTLGAAQWCSDPAWILWDLLTSRYGFGDHVKAAQLDKWAFYAASQYASTLVPDGFGGQEPRFSCNINIQTAEEAFKLINDMCSVFRAMPYWSTGALTISQDRPADSAYLFTLANVSEEGFSYQGSSRKTRPSVAVVSYLDIPSRQIAYEVVEDQAAIAKHGVVTTQISAFACTSRGQASRIGEWLLYSEQMESEVVSFTASIDAGVVVRPGQIIEISDPVKAGSRRGGRITAATTTTVTVDDASGLAAGAAATLSVILPNGTVQSSAVTAIAGNVVSLATPLATPPNANSVWLYQTSNIQTTTWRVLSVQEQDGAKYAISALAYNASKYDYIERGARLQQRDITDLNVIPAAPTNLQAVETLYEVNGRALAKLIISWQPVVGVNEYRVRWRPQNGNWTSTTQARPDFEILDTTAGVYEVQVYSLNAALRQSVEPAKLTVQAFGKTAPPESVTGLSLIPIDNASAILSWDRSPELDVVLGGKVLIRHSVLLTGAIWEESQEIVAAAAGSQTQKQVPLLEGTYLVKFEDDGTRRSLVASTVIVDLPTPQPRQLVQTYAEELESPPFNGNYTDMFYVASLAEAGGAGGIMLSSGLAVDAMATDGDWDALASIDSVGGVLPEGEYEFGSTYSFPGVFDCNLRRRLVTLPYIPGDFWDDHLEDIDTWDFIDGTGADRVNALTYVRTTQDDPSGTPTWSTWREFANAIVRGRGFQFKTVATSTDPTQNIIIEELGAELELQQRAEQSATLTSGATAYVATFANAFFEAPSVGVTGFNMTSGDYFEIALVTRNGFQVTFKNSAGTAVSRQFTYTAIGFGRQI